MRKRTWNHQRMKTVLMRSHLSRSVVRSLLPRYADFSLTPWHGLKHFLFICVLQPSVPGAMSIDAVCQEGTFVVENVSFYKDSKLATELTAEADWKRRGLYIGPQVRFACFLSSWTLRLKCLLHTSSRHSTLAFRRSSISSSKSVVLTTASRSSCPSTRSIRNKRYACCHSFQL